MKTNVETGVLIDIKGREPSKFNYAEVNHDNGSVSFYDDRSALICTLPIDVVDGRFPYWRRVASITPGSVDSIGFSLRYLADAYKISKAYKNEIARFDFQDQTNGCKISFSNTAFMVLMPARFIAHLSMCPDRGKLYHSLSRYASYKFKKCHLFSINARKTKGFPGVAVHSGNQSFLHIRIPYNIPSLITS